MTVVGLTRETGFFSMLFRLCTALLTYGPRLLVNSSDWHHGRWGWYFTSLAETTDPPTLSCMNVPNDVPRWTLGDYRRALSQIIKPSAVLRCDVRNVLAQIGRPFTALFVRRGDKLVQEAKYIPMSDILGWITYDESTVFFVQTDDYTVVEEMRALLPNHTIHTTVPPTKRGSYHSPRYSQTGYTPWTEKLPEEARAETTEMLVGLLVCLAADQCWTDDTSNVGRFLKLMGPRVRIYPDDYSVDEGLHAHPAWSIHA